MARQFKDRGRQ